MSLLVNDDTSVWYPWSVVFPPDDDNDSVLKCVSSMGTASPVDDGDGGGGRLQTNCPNERMVESN